MLQARFLRSFSKYFRKLMENKKKCHRTRICYHTVQKKNSNSIFNRTSRYNVNLSICTLICNKGIYYVKSSFLNFVQLYVSRDSMLHTRLVFCFSWPTFLKTVSAISFISASHRWLWHLKSGKIKL